MNNTGGGKLRNADILRRKAEEFLNNRLKGSKQDVDSDRIATYEFIEANSLKLVNEMEVTQIELEMVNEELLFQNEEKDKRATELILANKELFFQNEEKEKRAAELILANKELLFQNEEKEKRAAELAFANKELALKTELASAYEELKLKNIVLQKISAEKDKFYSIIAHDLRGPISAIKGLCVMMADDSQYMTEQERKDLTLVLSRSSTNVFNLLEQLLEWSKSEQGLTDFNPQTLVLNDLVTKSVKIVGEQARRKSVDLIVDIATDLNVFADQNMLQTILLNLISNAIKFTRQGGNVAVTGQAGENKSTLISVKDTGIGMGKNILENLFRMDVDTKRMGTNGERSTGLGILLCKEFIEKHGGSITVKSEEGKGSAFSFTIPYHEPIIGVTSLPVAIPEAIKNNAINSLNILIAEDHEISAVLLRAMIKGFSKEILIVTNGIDAVKTIRNNPDIDLILLDIAMPKLDGYEATRQIREFNKDVIIIAQTAFGLSGDREKAIEAGCNDFILKPINEVELTGLIQKYFKN